MDEASIISAIQADLQNYKVKTQIRRKESQLHILLTRSDGDDLDYASLYDIVKRRIDKLTIEGADSLVVYGRLAGAKHPEWQKKAEIKPPLPLIELDLDELEEFDDIGELGNLTFPTEEDEDENQVRNFELEMPDNLKDFKNSIENDLKTATKAANNTQFSNRKNEDFDLDNLDLQELQLDNFNQNAFDIDPFELNSSDPNYLSAVNNKKVWLEEDISLDAPTVAIPPMPLPPPPPTRRINKVVPEIEAEQETEDPSMKTTTIPKSWLLSGAVAAMAIAAVGQQYLDKARDFDSQNLNPQKITKLDTLTETRNQLQTIISQLETVSDRPASLYADAQSELTTLRPKLEQFDRKINIEQVANKNLDLSKNLTIEAVKLTQNPPHKSTVWKAAQDKRKQALKVLEEISPDSLLYPDAQARLKAYRAELVQISKWVEIQQRAELSANNLTANTINQIKQFKAKAPSKQKFLPQCKVTLQNQISNAEAQRAGLPAVALAEYLCAYFWDS